MTNNYERPPTRGEKIFIVSMTTVLVTFAAILIFWVFYAFIKYGGKPIDEIPAWALRFMFK